MRRVTFVVSAVAVALAASALLSAPPKGMAALKLPAAKEGLTCELTFKDGSRVTFTSKGSSVRPGTYDVKTVVILKQDDKKTLWRMSGSEKMGTLDRFMVDEGQEKVLDVGPPILFAMRAWRPSATSVVNITVEASGNCGEVYYPGAYTGAQPPPPPALQVLDEDGKKVLATGRLVYSKGTSSYTWQPPAGYKGKFTVQIKPAMGPFEWKYEESYTGAAVR